LITAEKVNHYLQRLSQLKADSFSQITTQEKFNPEIHSAFDFMDKVQPEFLCPGTSDSEVRLCMIFDILWLETGLRRDQVSLKLEEGSSAEAREAFRLFV